MFITFEGIDGSGKTTQLNLLKNHITFLTKAEVHVTSALGNGSGICNDIKNILFNNLYKKDINIESEILLIMASIQQISTEIIKLDKEQWNIVLCDRYIDSLIAYHAFGHNVKLDKIENILNNLNSLLYPDITFYLEIPLEIGLHRENNNSRMRISYYEYEFYKSVKKGYDYLFDKSDKIIKINANQSIQKVHHDIIKKLYSMKVFDYNNLN